MVAVNATDAVAAPESGRYASYYRLLSHSRHRRTRKPQNACSRGRNGVCCGGIACETQRAGDLCRNGIRCAGIACETQRAGACAALRAPCETQRAGDLCRNGIRCTGIACKGQCTRNRCRACHLRRRGACETKRAGGSCSDCHLCRCIACQRQCTRNRCIRRRCDNGSRCTARQGQYTRDGGGYCRSGSRSRCRARKPQRTYCTRLHRYGCACTARQSERTCCFGFDLRHIPRNTRRISLAGQRPCCRQMIAIAGYVIGA
jgi:hypothetical protein